MEADMRLIDAEVQAILKSVEKMDPDADVILYGSRLNDALKGGDIDLLVISESLSFADKIDILMAIKDLLGDQRIDLSIKSRRVAERDPFFAEVLKSGCSLRGL